MLDEKSKRLKDLINHVVEASKATSGNIKVEKGQVDLYQLMQQMLGEFEETFEKKLLKIVMEPVDQPIIIESDSQLLYRIIENLMTNISKYSLEGTRVYINYMIEKNHTILEMKNISSTPLNIPVECLSERFVRGDDSRNTEGNGLGLSIASSLAEVLEAKLVIEIDGDLFKSQLRL